MSEARRFSHYPTRVLSIAVAALGLCLPGHAGEADPSGAEAARRQQAAMEAQELLLHGDRAYENGDYQKALAAYTGALDGLPKAPATAAMRDAAIDRMVTAAIALSQKQARQGDLDAAKKTLNRVLAEGVAPDDVRARQALAKLDDPIRTNPALTREHARNVDEVRRALYTAEGHFNLGRYDEARASYEKVLRIDPTNKAARRGLERLAAARSDYARAAYDHTRAEMLAQVDREWELQIKEPAKEGVYGELETIPGAASPETTIEAKLNNIVFPVVDMEDTTLVEAADFLRQQSRTLDTSSLDPLKRGIEIVLQVGQGDTPESQAIRSARINLKLRHIPLRKLLDYITRMTHTIWEVEAYAVVIRPAGSSSKTLINRTYHVPPDFLSTAGGGANANQPQDPFADNGGQEGLLARKLTAQQVLEHQGIRFPEGASASFNPSTSTLVVRNTADQQSLIQQIVDASIQTEPVQVVVKVTIMKTEERRLKELGFDWLMGPVPLGGGLFISGGTTGNGSQISPLSPPGTTFDKLNPLTSGNRSGDAAAPDNAIDTLINDTQQGFARASRRAPGVLSLYGLFDKVQFEMIIRALDQKKGVDVLSTPSVVTRSGQRASVHVVREMIYPTEYEPPELPNSVGGDNNFNGGGFSGQGAFPVTPATPTAFEKRDLGMILEVEPVVGPQRRYIDLVLDPEISKFDGFVNYGSPINSTAPSAFGGDQTIEITPNEILMPIFSVNRAHTALTIADGATVLIGGLLQEHVTKVEDKVPVFGDIPLIGRLFQSKSTKPDRKVIMFFVTVNLVDPAGKPFHKAP